MSEHIPRLDADGLRRFGLVLAAMTAGVFGIGLPVLFGLELAWWPWALAAGFLLWALIAPTSMRGFYWLWMRIGLVINAIVSRIVLGLVYYLTVLPVGLIIRACGKDPLNRDFDPAAESYREESEASDPEQMRKPF